MFEAVFTDRGIRKILSCLGLDLPPLGPVYIPNPTKVGQTHMADFG